MKRFAREVYSENLEERIHLTPPRSKLNYVGEVSHLYWPKSHHRQGKENYLISDCGFAQRRFRIKRIKINEER